jgi:hypothetical protein
MRACVLAIGLLLLPISRAAAQSEGEASGRTAAQSRLWGASVTFRSGFDSNIDHDEVGLDAFGVAVGTGFRLQTSVDRPLLQFEYEVGRHSYRTAPQWNRVSHNLRAVVERRVARRLTLGADLEGSFKGSTEDNDLSDQFILKPHAELRLHGQNRLEIYGAHRVRRYPDSAERDATNRYVGVEYKGRVESGERWALGFRREVNEGAGLRYQYDRDTFYVEHSTPMPKRGSLQVEVKYRSRIFRHRLAEVDDVDVPRHDQYWIPRASWLHPVTSRLDVELGYTFDRRTSNNLGSDYRAHYTSLMLRVHY